MATERLKRQIERLLDEAEQAVSQLNWRVVKARAEAVLAFDPGNGDAQAFLAAADRALETAGGPLPETPPLSPSPAAVSSAQPTSFANGRYQVKKFLGEGGKKKVYLAHDTLLDRDVAFALIKTEGLDEVSRTRITREAQAMGRLGSHPHIVIVFDLGSHENQPFMVTELMGGGDVEGAIEKAPDHNLPLELAVRIAMATCRGLEFAHSRGIVHRDLKPGNVWLTSEGTAKIGDFGLAVALDRSRLTAEGLMVGTVSYMPPEQALGGAVTPQSDLYSLGAMLYEMVTGRPPFLGDDPVAIIGQHINTPAVAPTWHNPQCPRPLEAMILRLLAKDPKERPASAADVRQALESIDLTDAGSGLPPALDEAHALDSLAGGVFVGRQREMGELKAALEEALSGKGKLVTLVGEPGIGKTRTALELATYAGLRQCQVLWGRSYEGTGAPPYWPWVQAIRSYVREREASQVQQEMGSGAADIAEIVSEVRERFPDLKPPQQLEPEQARFRVFDSITSFLKSASRHQPLVLVLEDLHWADRPSLMLLEFLARELGNSRLLVLGSYRDVEVNRRHPLAETLGELTRERRFQRVLLRGLSQEDVGRFIELVSGVTPPLGLVESVYRQTEGNPLFVTEVVRLLVQEGELSRESTGQRESWTVRIPEEVREVIGRRLDRLSERCNQTLTIAAVVGREFELRQLKSLVEDMTEDRLLEVLEEALATRIIEELPRTLGRYQFTHALNQETLLEELSLTRRVRLHARIAQELEKLYGQHAEAHAAELAHHFGQAEAMLGPEKVVKYSLLAGEKALASYAWEEALAHFQRGLESKGGDPVDAQTAALLFGLGRSQAATLDRIQFGAAVKSLSRAFDYYADNNEVDHAVAVAEYPLSSTIPALFAGATQMIPRALDLVPTDSLQAGYLLSRYGLDLGRVQGNYKGAQEAFARALKIATEENEALLEMRTLTTAAEVDYWFCRYQDGLTKCLQSLELVREVDDPSTERSARLNAAWSCVALGDLDGANLHSLASLDVAKKIGNRDLLGQSLATAAMIAGLMGDSKSAGEFLDLAPARSTRLLIARIVLAFESGNFDEGRVYLQQLLDRAEDYPPGPSSTASMPALLIPYIARLTGVLDGVENARTIANSILSIPTATPSAILIVRFGLGLIAVMHGDVEDAREQYLAIKQWRGTNLTNLVVTDRLLGLLAQTWGDLNVSADHFEDSQVFCRRGYRPELAWTCCDYADTLLARNQPGDRQRAMAFLDECLKITRELGMRPLMERALSRREILKA